MAPEELTLMKKYLRGCIERIEDIEQKLNIAVEPETPVFTEPEIQEPTASPGPVTEVQEVVYEGQPVAETEVNEPETISPVAEQIIIDPEQSRTVSTLVTETPLVATQEPEMLIAEPETISSTIVDSVEEVPQSAFVLVAAETEEVPVIAQEEKRSWADLWEENSTPVNNGLVSESSEPEMPFAETVARVTEVTAITEPVAEVSPLSLVGDDEPETEVVSTIVEIRSETTLNDVLQTRKETGLFEMFGNQQEAPAPGSAPVQNGNNHLPVSDAAETDVLVAEIESNQPEFSLSNIFSQMRTPSEERTRTAKTLSESIALNDKFIFVRELFGNQFNEYENALRHLDNLNGFNEAEQYCRQYLEERFRWNERTANAEKFYALLDKRFNG